MTKTVLFGFALLMASTSLAVTKDVKCWRSGDYSEDGQQHEHIIQLSEENSTAALGFSNAVNGEKIKISVGLSMSASAGTGLVLILDNGKTLKWVTAENANNRISIIENKIGAGEVVSFVDCSVQNR